MRAFVYNLLASDVAIRDMGLRPDAVYAANAADTPTAPVFMVLHFGASSPGVGVLDTTELQVWVYDGSRGSSDYTRIDTILARVRELLEAQFATRTAEGSVAEVQWQGNSDDLWDDGYERITRWSSFRMVWSRA